MSDDSQVTGDEPSLNRDTHSNEPADSPALGGDLAVLHFAEHLDDPNPEIRQKAIFALAEVGDERALAGLIGIMRTQSPYGLGRRAAEALAPFGSKALPLLLELLAEGDYYAQGCALLGLGSVAAANHDLLDTILPVLVNGLAEQGVSRQMAAMALDKIGKYANRPDVVNGLFEAMIADVRRPHFESQASNAPASALALIGDSHEVIQRMLAHILEVPRLSELLPELVSDGVGDVAGPYLLAALHDARYERYWLDIIDALCISKNADPQDRLLELLSLDPMLQFSIVQALGCFQVRRAVPKLLEMLKVSASNEYGADSEIIRALGRIGDLRAAPYIRPHLHNNHTAAASVEALVALNDIEGIPELCKMLNTSIFAVDAASALLQIGTPDAIAAVEAWGLQNPERYATVRESNQARSEFEERMKAYRQQRWDRAHGK